MTREGYNSAWLWKQWQRECSEARRAIAEGRYVAAEALLEAAEMTSDAIVTSEGPDRRNDPSTDDPTLPFTD